MPKSFHIDVAAVHRLRSIAQKMAGGAIAFGCTMSAWADEKLFAAPANTHTPAPSGAGSMAQATLALVLVLIAVFAAAFFLKRLRKFGGAAGAHGIEIISQATLGSKERAVLLKVGGSHVLVGVAPGTVNLLHVLDPHSIPADAAPATEASNSVVPPNFKSLLKQSLGLK